MKGKDFDLSKFVSKHYDVIEKEDFKYRKAVIEEEKLGLVISDYDKYKRAKNKENVLTFVLYLMLLGYLVAGIVLGYTMAADNFMSNCLEQVNLYDVCKTVSELIK